jgi:hypothetical protein
MRAVRITIRAGAHDVLVIGPTTLITEVVLIASVAILTLALHAAAPDQRVWPALVFVAGAAVAAVFPDSPVGLFALCWYAGAWLALTPETSTSLAWAVPASIAATALHGALALVAALPPGGDVEPRAAAGIVGRFGLSAVTGVLVALPVPLSRGALLPDAAAGVLLLFLAAVPRLALGGSRD